MKRLACNAAAVAALTRCCGACSTNRWLGRRSRRSFLRPPSLDVGWAHRGVHRDVHVLARASHTDPAGCRRAGRRRAGATRRLGVRWTGATGGHSEVIAQSLVGFGDGEFSWELATLPITDTAADADDRRSSDLRRCGRPGGRGGDAVGWRHRRGSPRRRRGGRRPRRRRLRHRRDVSGGRHDHRRGDRTRRRRRNVHTGSRNARRRSGARRA